MISQVKFASKKRRGTLLFHQHQNSAQLQSSERMEVMVKSLLIIKLFSSLSKTMSPKRMSITFHKKVN